MAVAAPQRPKVTGAFLTRAGGYATDGKKLYRVLAVRQSEVLMEDCAKDPMACAVWRHRATVLKLRVVRWPAGLE